MSERKKCAFNAFGVGRLLEAAINRIAIGKDASLQLKLALRHTEQAERFCELNLGTVKGEIDHALSALDKGLMPEAIERTRGALLAMEATTYNE